MAHRKSALIFLLLFLLILILWPWASAPSPNAPEVPKRDAGPSADVVPVLNEDPVRLRIAVALNEPEFRLLQKQNEELAYRFQELEVELMRVDPHKAYSEFRRTSQIGEAADVMLLENEWVVRFAVSGYLLPVDGAFVGEALAEQFDALSAAVKWNGYLWAVPRDFDPYVMVWNMSVLRSILGETAVTPQGPAQWSVLAEKSHDLAKSVSWLAIDGRDPYALLAWLQNTTGQRTDTLWKEGGSVWNGTPRGDAMVLLDRERQGVSFTETAEQPAALIAAGKAVAAVVPYSIALGLTDGDAIHSLDIVMDRSAWKLPFHWPRGRSYAVSSRTQAEDAARRWIAIITEAQMQQENERAFGKLPVYRSLYASGTSRSLLLTGSEAGTFPNSAPEPYGPELPVRMQALSRLWTEWAEGRLNMPDWVRRWPETSSDFELND